MTGNGLVWFKSSHSGQGGCLEVAYAWHTSSYGDARDGGAVPAHRVRVRDSKVADSPLIGVGAPAWSAFLSAVRRP